ncbi:MAG: hypothetical protein ACK4M7_01405 [Burkholderiales bacterium]
MTGTLFNLILLALLLAFVGIAYARILQVKKKIGHTLNIPGVPKLLEKLAQEKYLQPDSMFIISNKGRLVKFNNQDFASIVIQTFFRQNSVKLSANETYQLVNKFLADRSARNLANLEQKANEFIKNIHD